jgi:pre-mRNA-processing factor 17
VLLRLERAYSALVQDPAAPRALITRATDTQMLVNIPYADMLLPTQGPENPFGDRHRFANQNALAGHVEEQDMSEHAFRQQHLTFSILGYAANPSIDPNAPAVLGAVDAARANGFATVDTMRPAAAVKKELKRKRGKKGDLEVVEGDGAYVGPWAAWQGDEPQHMLPAGVEPPAEGAPEDDEPDSEDEAAAAAAATRKGRAKPRAGGTEEYSVFHGKQTTDYQGRTYMHAPVADAPQLTQETGTQDCFIPKVCVHTWTGHTQGVSVVRTFPGTGHMFLSGSMDTKIKVRACVVGGCANAERVGSCGTSTRTGTACGRSTGTARPSRT